MMQCMMYVMCDAVCDAACDAACDAVMFAVVTHDISHLFNLLDAYLYHYSAPQSLLHGLLSNEQVCNIPYFRTSTY